MSAPVSINEIKFIKSLAQKKFRDESGLFIVEGEKMVDEALHSSFKVESVYREKEVGTEVMSRITLLSSPSPALALVRMPEDSMIDDLAAFKMPLKGLFLALDGIRNPGNLGTIIRIADWFGIDGIFASPDTVEVFNPKVVQASMGAVFRVAFHYCDLPSICLKFSKEGCRVFGSFLDGEDIYSQNLDNGALSPSLIVIGNESDGISEQVAKVVTDRIYVPSYPRDERGSESLNAAIATAVIVAEFRRGK